MVRRYRGRHLRVAATVVALISLSVACRGRPHVSLDDSGDSPGTTGGTGGGGATGAEGGSAGTAGSAGMGGSCPTLVGTAEDIAATPRADENLELLALTLDAGEVTATQATYDRVTADVASIRELEPTLADIGHLPRYDGKTLYLYPDAPTGRSIQSGEYSAWDCLNGFYGVASQEALDSLGSTFVILELKGNYAMDVVARLYAELPGMERVDPTPYGIDGPTICAGRVGDVYEYVVDRAGGDCPAGCTTHDAHRFRSVAAGEVEALETWDSGNGAAAPEWPEWFVRLCP